MVAHYSEFFRRTILSHLSSSKAPVLQWRKPLGRLRLRGASRFVDQAEAGYEVVRPKEGSAQVVYIELPGLTKEWSQD